MKKIVIMMALMAIIVPSISWGACGVGETEVRPGVCRKDLPGNTIQFSLDPGKNAGFRARQGEGQVFVYTNPCPVCPQVPPVPPVPQSVTAAPAPATRYVLPSVGIYALQHKYGSGAGAEIGLRIPFTFSAPYDCTSLRFMGGGEYTGHDERLGADVYGAQALVDVLVPTISNIFLGIGAQGHGTWAEKLNPTDKADGKYRLLSGFVGGRLAVVYRPSKWIFAEAFVGIGVGDHANEVPSNQTMNGAHLGLEF